MLPVEQRNVQTFAIIGAAMEVYNQLGRGFLELAYQEALAIEFDTRHIQYEREVPLKIMYKGHPLLCTYKADFVRYGEVVVETKAIRQLGPADRAQVLNELKATRLHRALLINFGGTSLEYERISLRSS